MEILFILSLIVTCIVLDFSVAFGSNPHGSNSSDHGYGIFEGSACPNFTVCQSNATHVFCCSTMTACCGFEQCCKSGTYCCKDEESCCPTGTICCGDLCCESGKTSCVNNTCVVITTIDKDDTTLQTFLFWFIIVMGLFVAAMLVIYIIDAVRGCYHVSKTDDENHPVVRDEDGNKNTPTTSQSAETADGYDHSGRI